MLKFSAEVKQSAVTWVSPFLRCWIHQHVSGRQRRHCQRNSPMSEEQYQCQWTARSHWSKQTNRRQSSCSSGAFGPQRCFTGLIIATISYWTSFIHSTGVRWLYSITLLQLLPRGLCRRDCCECSKCHISRLFTLSSAPEAMGATKEWHQHDVPKQTPEWRAGFIFITPEQWS